MKGETRTLTHFESSVLIPVSDLYEFGTFFSFLLQGFNCSALCQILQEALRQEVIKAKKRLVRRLRFDIAVVFDVDGVQWICILA